MTDKSGLFACPNCRVVVNGSGFIHPIRCPNCKKAQMVKISPFEREDK